VHLAFLLQVGGTGHVLICLWGCSTPRSSDVSNDYFRETFAKHKYVQTFSLLSLLCM
jgi:hypothetical protein